MAAAAVFLMESKHKADASSPPGDPDSHIDRNSAIALSLLLFLVLVAIAWYVRLHFAQKRQADLERQAQAGEGQADSAMGRVTWNRQCSSCGEESRRARIGSLFKLKSATTRSDSVATSSAGGSLGTGEREGEGQKRKWPGLSQWRTQDARTWPLGPNAFAIHQDTLPLTSTERPCPALSRRQSHKALFHPLPLHNPIHHSPAHRRSSCVSQGTYDKRWWNEVARRGSATSPTRQSSVLEAEARRSVGETPNARGSSTVNRDRGGGSTGSAHTSWKGSRCESVMYDWTRPTDAEAQASSEMNFQGVIWNRPHGRTPSNAKALVENIQSVDWALRM